MHVWLNGSIVDAATASVPVDNHGLVVGDGVFETMKVIRGQAFALTRHLRRLSNNLAAMAIEHPGDELLRRAVTEAIEASAMTDSRLRLTVTGGTGSLGSGAPTGRPEVIVAVTELSAPREPIAMTVPWVRNERGALTGLKTTSYGENVRMLRAAQDAGAGEALMANTVGELCEGTGSNVFVVRDGQALTPPLTSGCLNGIVRELVLEIADVREESLPFDALFNSDEVFLTSSIRDVQGLTRIDDHELTVGPVTTQIAADFASLMADRLDP